MMVFGVLVAIVLSSGPSSAQANPPEAFQRYLAERQRLVAVADAAWDREMPREQAAVCPNALTTYDVNECLKKEVEITTANHDAYVQAFRAVFALRTPNVDPPDRDPGSSVEAVNRFDEIEAMWQKYRAATCSLSADFYRGGTVAPATEMQCELRLLRSHMRELGGILGEGFHR